MFRQVVMYRWHEGLSTEDLRGFREALERLRAIPELIDMTCGDDVGLFEGNFDFVVVMDFAEFESARRYVAHPLHQTYVRDYANRVVAERVIVQHEWDGATPRP